MHWAGGNKTSILTLLPVTKYSPSNHRTSTCLSPQLLIRVVPHMDQMDRVLPYLAELGALHQRHGVAKQHIDLLGLAFCAAIRGVVQVTFLYHLWQCCILARYNIKYACLQGGGVKGGHLHETTKAWITLVQVRTPAVLQCVVTMQCPCRQSAAA